MNAPDSPAPFEADERVETVARALAHSDAVDATGEPDPPYDWDALASAVRREYRRLAAAAIAATPPSPSPAEEAVKRVEALAEDFDRFGAALRLYAGGAVAERIRAALASPAPAPHVHGAWCHPSADGCPDDLR